MYVKVSQQGGGIYVCYPEFTIGSISRIMAMQKSASWMVGVYELLYWLHIAPQFKK